MSKFLSILIPSNRPDELERFITSLRENADNFNNIELIILVDDDERKYVRQCDNIITIHNPKQSVLNMSELNYECYKHSSGRWIMFGNDDTVMQTKHWDSIIKEACSKFEDKVALIYPDDNMFHERLACFPIISRRVIEATKLFPMLYRRYKIDDTIFGMFPVHRRIYLDNVKLTHLNDQGKEGFTLSDGRVYPIEREAADYDNEIWKNESRKRYELSLIVRKLMTASNENVKVFIGVSTGEVARRPTFYDWLDMLEKPEGTVVLRVHGQSPAKARNVIIEEALRMDATHVFFLDDDMAFTSDILMKLLARDKDVVTGFYVHRQYPHYPVLFNHRASNDGALYYFPEDTDRGLQPITNCGLGICLIKTDVLRKMTPPYVTLGAYDSHDMWCDDIYFFNKLKDETKAEMFVDLDCIARHDFMGTVRPQFLNGKWYITYNTDGSGEVSFEMIRAPKEALEEARKL